MALALVAPSCNREAPQAGDKKKTVALVLKTLNHPFFVDMRRGAQDAADRLGVTLQVQAAEREIDVDKQMQIVENLLQTGIDALAITPSGSREIVSALVKATAANVPIVIVDTRLDAKAAADAGVKAKTFIGSDNYEGGKLAGEYVVTATGGKARVGILEGIPGPRDRRFALARFPRRGGQEPRHHHRRVTAGELGARSGLQRLPEHAAGAPGHRHGVCRERLDGPRRDRGDRRRRQDRKDPRHRVRRPGRCEEGDCGRDHGRVGGAVSVRDGQGGGGKRGEGDERRDSCRRTSW